MPRRLLPLAAALLACTLAAAGCGRDRGQGAQGATPVVGVKGDAPRAATDLGFPVFATKNTVRVGGGDAVADAAAAARAVYPVPEGAPPRRGPRPPAIAIADTGDWQGALAASVLMAAPLGAPVLYSDGEDLPKATADAIDALGPTGARSAGSAQIIRIGDVARPPGLRTVDIAGQDPFTLARAIDAFAATARGTTSDRVLIVSADAPAFATPAAAWAAKSGDPILFVTRDAVPAPTVAALRAHQQPRIYVLGPPSAVGERAMRTLRTLGAVTRISGATPVENAVAFARYRDGRFGWGIVDPGHGFVFTAAGRPLDAPAAAPLSASGSYGPMLLLPGPPPTDLIPPAVRGFLLDVQPGYTSDPVRGVYNRAWIVGDTDAISFTAQSRIDQLLDIVPVTP